VDPAAIELPGNAVQAQLYLNKEVWVKFGIYAGTTLQFEELHKTKTDGYGLINLEIGAGENTVAAGTFASIKWSSTLMKLVTQVSFNQGAKYTEVSNRGLNYLPYAHFSEEAGRLTGILTVTSGGTGATSAPAARANLGLGNVDNTADVDKPVSGLVLAELTSKESILNKSNSIISDSASSLKYPSVKAVKAYVDNRTANANVANQANSANLAAKATTLETPRTINGVPFDGSANISIPIDAAILTGIIPITKGGTGAVTASSARTNLGLKIGVDVQAPLVAGTDYQRPLFAGINYQIPLIAGTDYQRPLISGTDYQVPLVGGVDYQRPLVSGRDYQTPITAGSGISISSGSVAATGLTTANLSATAGITNGQLASSTLTLGSTTAVLGGTYTNVAGLTLASPVLTGIPTAPTAVASDNSQQIATTAFVKAVTASLGSVTTVPSISVNAVGNTFSSTVANPTTTPQLSLSIPLASASGTTAGLLSNSDYANFNAKQTALTAGVDYQRPLVSGTDYQTPLSAGSGISISSGSVAATGLTTANLSATAGITNAQLANSGFTLGTTTAALGGTYSNVADLTLASPVLTGIPTAPTATTPDNSQQIATTAFVKAVTASLGSVTSVPSISVNAAGNTFTSTVANATTTPQLSLTIPLASASGTTAGLLSNSDYANFNAKQTALTAGSGIAINSGSIAATGLTTANLSATASITNGQLANSRITLGSTNATLGGTFTSVTGLSSVASTSFVGALTGNATTATTLQTPRTIFGASFDGSAALAGTISPTYGGTGVNNGSNTLTLGGNLSTSGSFATILTTTAATSITLPVSGTLATLLGTETLSNKTLTSPVFSGTTTFNGPLTLSGANVLTAGGTIFPTATGTTGQVLTLSTAGNAAWSAAGTTVREVFDETASNGSTGTLSAATSAQVNFTLSQTPNSLSKLRMFINGILISQNAYSYQTSGSFNSTTATPTRYLTYVNTYNGSYTISAGDRVQFVYFY